MTDDQILRQQWHTDAILMRDLLATKSWAVLQRYLEHRTEDAMAALMSAAPSDSATIVERRGELKGLKWALDCPEWIIGEDARLKSQ